MRTSITHANSPLRRSAAGARTSLAAAYSIRRSATCRRSYARRWRIRNSRAPATSPPRRAGATGSRRRELPHANYVGGHATKTMEPMEPGGCNPRRRPKSSGRGDGRNERDPLPWLAESRRRPSNSGVGRVSERALTRSWRSPAARSPTPEGTRARARAHARVIPSPTNPPACGTFVAAVTRACPRFPASELNGKEVVELVRFLSGLSRTLARTSTRGHTRVLRRDRCEPIPAPKYLEIRLIAEGKGPLHQLRTGQEMYPFRTRTGRSAWPAQTKGPANETKADARTRTEDPFITSEVLYQLSYVGTASGAGFEYSPAP